jgi:hypothetical protein
MTRRPRPQAPAASRLAPLPERVTHISGPLAALPVAAPVDRLTYRLDALATALGVRRRTLERERSAGRLPRPDLQIGKMPLWRPETIRRWIEGGGK